MSDDLVGQVVGPYLLESPLGTGGMATVYRGVHRYMHVARAVKVMAPTLAAHERFVRLFHREAQLAASLNHPNIVRIHDVGMDGVTHFLVMELLEGRSLRELIRQDRPLAMDRVLTLVKQLGSALDYAHHHGIAHRDVKPANIFVGSDDHLTLVDLGIARAADHTRLTVTQGAGTPEYMAPEMFDEDLADPGHDDHARAVGADLYSFGLVAYELLTGALPFKARSRQAVIYSHVHRSPIPPRSHRPDLLPAVEAVILRQLSKRPFERYGTASAFADALTHAADTAAVEPHAALDAERSDDITLRSETDPDDLQGNHPSASFASGDQPTEHATGSRSAPRAADIGRPVVSNPPAVLDQPATGVEAAVPRPPLARPDALPPLPPGAPSRSVLPGSSRSPGRAARQARLPLLIGLTAVATVLLAVSANLMVGRMVSPPASPPVATTTVVAPIAPTSFAGPSPVIGAAPISTMPLPVTSTPPAVAPTQPAPAATAALASPTLSPMDQLQAGQAAAFAGDFSRAIVLLTTLKRDHPSTSGLDNALYRSRIDYAAALRDLGEFEQSLEQLDEALLLRPGDVPAITARQETDLLAKWAIMEASWGTDDARAIDVLESIWSVQPDYRQTRQKLYALLISKADRLLAQDDRNGAFPVLMRALDVQPEAPEARARLGNYTPTPVPVPTRAPTRPPAPTPVPPQPTRQPAPQPTATKVPFLPAP